MFTLFFFLFFGAILKCVWLEIFPSLQSQQRLIFESEMCPSLIHQSPLPPGNLSVLDDKKDTKAAIILKHTCGEWMDTDAECDCNFSVILPPTYPFSLNLPSNCQLVGVTMTNDKRFPWPTRKKAYDPRCKLHVQISVDNKKRTRNRPDSSEKFCTVTNQFLATPHKSPQWGIWKDFQPLPILYQIESGRLAINVDKELDFTLKSKSSIRFLSSFVHLVFIFKSKGNGCYIRIEHFKVLKAGEIGCDTGETTGCEILPCSEEVRLGYIMRKMWHERFYFGHKNTSKSTITYQLNHFNSIASMNPKQTEDRAIGRSLLPMIFLFKTCIILIVLGVRQKKKKQNPQVPSSSQSQTPHQAIVQMNFATNTAEMVIVPVEAAYNTRVTEDDDERSSQEYLEAKDAPPNYQDVIAMDKLSPPAYSDVFPFKTIPPSNLATAV